MDSLSSQQELYRRQAERALRALRTGRLRVILPVKGELYRRRPRTHFHPTPELFIQTGGATDFECPGGNFRLGTNQIGIIPRGVPHAETPLDLKTPYSILVCMHARDGMYIHRAVSPGGGRIVGHPVLQIVSARAREAFRYLDEIAAQESVPRTHRKGFVEGLLQAFLVTTLDEASRVPVKDVAGSPKVAEAEKLVWANLSNPELSVAMLASSLACSADYLSRIFHRERRMTLSRWIVQERVKMACEFLADLRYNISEVGWTCGFASASYFVRVFRELKNQTPKAYRTALLRNGG